MLGKVAGRQRAADDNMLPPVRPVLASKSPWLTILDRKSKPPLRYCMPISWLQGRSWETLIATRGTIQKHGFL